MVWVAPSPQRRTSLLFSEECGEWCGKRGGAGVQNLDLKNDVTGEGHRARA